MFAGLARRVAGMGRRRPLQLAFAAVAVLTLLLVFLFIRTAGIDLQAQNEVMLNLRELEKLDAEWNANILRARIGRGGLDENITPQLSRMHELQERLRAALPLTRGREARDAYEQMLRAMRDKERLVEQYQARTPPLNAALLYLPPAVARMKTELDGIEGVLAPARIVIRLDTLLNDLLSYILRFNLSPTPALASKIDETLGDIEAREIAFSPAMVEMIDALSRSARVILVNRPATNALERAIANTGAEEALDRLGRAFDRSFAQELARRQQFRGWLIAYSLVLLALLVYLGLRLLRSYRIIGEVNQRLQAANETLELRVAERTAELQAQSQQLEMLAQHDSLTGLVNVRRLTDLLEHALVRAGRRNTVVVVMFIDLDGFKAVNDTYGHATGDLVLQSVARRVQDKLRAEDALARLGGDEFVILLEEVGSREGALRVAQLALDQINGITEAGGHPVKISASIGIASARGRAGVARGAQALLADADHAMYQAKQAGKGVFVISPQAQWAGPDAG
ncbi:diguanylate cyclase domain-containing protein [Massilia horti]|uniref:Sensor domain-containing diguanylate cyclase n=1 Tax=Massilia horti TaxID=2562153 RepID=A0A4Y9STJ2_9BURK|nr:diguanylate cyclase [Massilia horti]TFW30112.1 sensor domain-containing diguanylate cyclase [Massilia horti]